MDLDDYGIYTVFFRRQGELREITVHDRVLALECAEGMAAKGFRDVDLIGPHVPEVAALADEAKERIWRNIVAGLKEDKARAAVELHEERKARALAEKQYEEFVNMFDAKGAMG